MGAESSEKDGLDFVCSLKKEDCNFTKQGPMRSSSVTLPAEFIEKAICMKTQELPYQRESARPRVVLRANSQCGLQDLPRQEARSSCETQSDAHSFRETGCNIVDCRVPSISLSTVQQQDERRQHTVCQVDRTKNKFLEI